VAKRGLLKGKTVGIDATTLEANAAMKSIMRRDTGETYMDYLRRMDRGRKKKTSNDDWVNPHDPEAEVMRMKDGTTHLAYKAEQAVDMETGAIVAVTTHGGATGDTTSMRETLQSAGEAVAGEIATKTDDGGFAVNEGGVEEVVTDKGYHSGAALRRMAEMGIRTYVSEPNQQRRRKWEGKAEEKVAVYANRRRVNGTCGKDLLKRRGEFLERPFAHQFEASAMRRLHVRGRDNVAKRLLLQAAACNLALILRSMGGAGTPRGLADLRQRLIFAFISILAALQRLTDQSDRWGDQASANRPRVQPALPRPHRHRRVRENWGLDTGC
jgi:transposase